MVVIKKRSAKLTHRRQIGGDRGRITVCRAPGSSTQGRLVLGRDVFACALGRSGMTLRKNEGDGATPVCHTRALTVFYRPDRVRRPRTSLPIWRLGPEDGWCDAAWDRNYNRPVQLPYPQSAENMWRADGLYDFGIVLDWNYSIRRHARGSAIFLHLATSGFAPTEGCVAVTPKTMVRILNYVSRDTVFEIV